MTDRRLLQFVGAIVIVVLLVIGALFWRQEQTIDDLRRNTAEDIAESRRTDQAICEAGVQLTDNQRAQINALANEVLDGAPPEDVPAIEAARNRLLELVPTFDCASLPHP